MDVEKEEEHAAAEDADKAFRNENTAGDDWRSEAARRTRKDAMLST